MTFFIKNMAHEEHWFICLQHQSTITHRMLQCSSCV